MSALEDSCTHCPEHGRTHCQDDHPTCPDCPTEDQ